MSIKVFCHGNCYDGFTSKWIAWLHFGEKAEYFDAFYEKDFTKEVDHGDEVWFIDFCPKAHQFEALIEKECSINLLDHHKTARDVAEGYREACDTFVFDMERSGAGIAWDYFFPNDGRPKLVDYIEDFDLWRFNLPETKQIQSYMSTVPYRLEAWSAASKLIESDGGVEKAVEFGRIAESFEDKLLDVYDMCTQLVEVDGYKVAVCNATSSWSKFGDYLLDKYDPTFAISYFVMDDGKIKLSLRSKGDFDVSDLAKRIGGGGHKNAAGAFIKNIDDLTKHMHNGLSISELIAHNVLGCE